MITKMLAVFIAFTLAFVSLGSPAVEAASVRTKAYATANYRLNLRAGPSKSNRVRRVIPTGARVWVASGPFRTYWYKITYRGMTGYSHRDGLRKGATAATTSSSSRKSTRGSAIAATAKRYIGYPYAKNGRTGNTPGEGFSCVGFTQWVYGRHGIRIRGNLWSQVSLGRSVSSRNLRAGDLVFFKNTLWPGLSHVGIYYGNGMFIDAGTPRTGVHWSKLKHWMYKWYGARRVVG